ncbi:BglG family transcription antiterminator [Selenomonas sp. TAMA-11512]|uniref:BglG family transcription antiterminator n=1 Tax=Selenomonas sp. TAMA-11512 TaxID=3095337 RepID=UPI00308B7A56|nr:BglG family transcription antiterminator [Selenomonas sp. TAMA-11512]
MFNERCLEILRVLLLSNRPLLVREIAEQANRSARSVQYHLKFLDDTLREMRLPPLVRSARNGILLPAAVRESASLRALLDERQGTHYAASPEERAQHIFFLLLPQPGYISMELLAERLSVSRATIVRDVRQLKSLAQCAGFSLSTAPNRGIRLTGDENAIRSMAFRFFARRVEEAYTLSPEDMQRDVFARMFEGQLLTEDFSFFESCIHEAESNLSVIFSESGFYALVLQLAIITLRLRSGHTLQEVREDKSALREQLAAKQIAERLSARFQADVPHAEQRAIAMHLLSSGLVADKRDFDLSEFTLHTLAGRILERMGDILNDAEMARDDRLFQSFFAHLRPAVYRLQQKLPIENPLLAEIRSEYGWLFNAVREGLKPAEAWAGTAFSDAEVAYFVLHFGAALERHGRLREEKRRVLIVCDHGIGTSELIAARIRMFFNVEIVATVSRRQAHETLRNANADLIITTVDLPRDLLRHTESVLPCILVSPLLTQRDLLQLGNFLPLRRRSPESLLQGVLQAATRHTIILDYPKLVEELSALLGAQEKPAFQKGGQMPMLKDVLTEDCIALNVKADDWEAAVRYGGMMMERLGMTEARYTESMLRTVKEMGSYIVIAPGLAMPHARPEDGAKRVGSVIVTLAEPVTFGNPDYDPVRVVVFLCAVDKVQHLKVLSDLMVLFEDDDFCDEICAQRTEKEALGYVLKKLEDGSDS